MTKTTTGELTAEQIELAERLADRAEVSEGRPLTPDQHAAAFAIRDARRARQAAEEAIEGHVAEARRLGVSWSIIATMLGVTRQAAQQRYGRR
jgi:hypothetical protein